MRLPLSSLRRPAARLVAGGAAVVLLAGCGGSSGSSSSESSDRLTPVAAVRAAAQTTADAGSSRFELTSTTQVAGQTVEVSGTGEYDPASRSGQATFTLPGGAGTMEQRYLGDDLYLAVPGQPGFFKLSVADLVGTSLETASQPTGSLDALESASDDVRETGEEEVRGAQTTRYEGTLDAGAALEQAGGALGDLAEAGIDPETISAVPFEAWIDEEGRLRRFELVLELPASEATGGTPVTSTTRMELFDFGVEVAVEPPPADQVQDGAPLLEALRSQAG